MENRCIICGKKLHNPYAIYCAECEYEIRRARLEDEETLEEYIERMREENKVYNTQNLEGIKPLDFWLSH
ncbi:hypothetical protein B6U71_03685 [Euryarchaeota archaeon ex4484_178]|nr:MAG: hypothetical protein B6U71_03685 [Euryarchaeota archaeon ex4484_178]